LDDTGIVADKTQQAAGSRPEKTAPLIMTGKW